MFFSYLPGEGLWILTKVELLLLLHPVLFLLRLLRLLLLRLMSALFFQAMWRVQSWGTPGPKHHIASSRCCGARLDPNTRWPAPNALKHHIASTGCCGAWLDPNKHNAGQIARSNARKNAGKNVTTYILSHRMPESMSE